MAELSTIARPYTQALFSAARAQNAADAWLPLLHGIDAVQSTQKAYAMMYQAIQAQATTLGYVDVVSVLALIVAALTPLAYIMKRGLPGTGGGGMH